LLENNLEKIHPSGIELMTSCTLGSGKWLWVDWPIYLIY